jgi:cytochrome c
MKAILSALRASLAPALFVALLALGTPGWADDAEDGRELYINVCSKCHGLVTEDAVSWTPRALTVMAVTLPLGPSLTGVYMRPAGIMPGYAYSKSFRAMVSDWVWDEDALDGWLINAQEFIRGSTMFLKVDEPTRGKIIAYLVKYARYTE